MISTLALTELAIRASNLSEITAITLKFNKQNPQKSFTRQLSSIESWTLNKVSSKLSTLQLKQEIHQQVLGDIPEQDKLQEILTNYKLYELNILELSEAERQIFLQQHESWLKVYQASLETLDLDVVKLDSNYWDDSDIYYGRFAKVCLPFLKLIQQELQGLCDENNSTNSDFIISHNVINNIQFELLNRFEISIARALEADINLYCYQNNLAKSLDTQAYITYIDNTFEDESSYHKFYCKFPILGRWLSVVTNFFCEFGKDLIKSLITDRDEIAKTFFQNLSISKIKSFKLGQSDPHVGSRSVVIIDLELSQSGQVVKEEKIVYKPRCIKSEQAFQNILGTLSSAEVIKFATYQVLCKDSYGYVEFLHVNNETDNQKVVECFYEQLGGYLAIIYILGGSDIHHENILVSNCNAFICDCETLLEVLPEGMERLQDTVFDSVFRIGMLDWPRADTTDMISISGYGGGESYQSPFAAPEINHRMSLSLVVEHKAGREVTGSSKNRIHYKGQIVDPNNYRDFIVEGFNKVYSWVQQNTTQVVRLIEDLFTSSTVRFINRATQIYARLLNTARHPKCLTDPLEVDLIFYSLIEYPRLWDQTGEIGKLEFASLWQLDVPIFCANASARMLSYNYEQQLPISLAISPIDNVVKRIRQLSSDNQSRQNQYIYASLSSNEISSPYFVASSVNYADQIGTQLCSELETSSNSSPWQTYNFNFQGKSLVDINTSLYNGSAGICLFLAYLNTVKPQEEFRQAAELALTYSIEKSDRSGIGAFQGTSGLIYLLTHLAKLWNQPTLLDKAIELCAEITPLIGNDEDYDILLGVAGVIPVMIGLSRATSGIGIECAELCAQHLLKKAVFEDGKLSWLCKPDLGRGNLTGFSHGASGIGWALILLGCHTNKSEYITAGLQAFAYETSQFDTKEGNWYDLRSSVVTQQTQTPKFSYFWCNGAAGIGLSRIASWAALGKTNTELLNDAHTALGKTLQSFSRVENDSLCHGRAGNGELLLRCANLLDEPYLRMEANVQATIQWSNFERFHRWNCGIGNSFVLPDLMTGLAGIGMHFLRLAYPEKIPSPLLLDPPCEITN